MAQQDNGTNPARVGNLNKQRLSAAYEPSHIGWIGNVPSTWAVVRVKGVVANVVDLTRGSDRDDIYLALEHVESWTGRFAVANKGVAFDSQVKRFRPRDVLFGKLRPYLAKVVCPGRGGVCAGEFLVLRPRIADLSAEYLEQLLRSKPVVDAIDASTFGAKMPRADWHFIGNMRLPLPPVTEQRAIVRFLNHADRRIRRYIRAKERLIELLEEQKHAIIHQAVTGQIDVRTGEPYPAYKRSGVEWLGEVPEHWTLSRVKAEFQCLNRNRVPLSSVERGKMTSRRYDYYGASGIIDKVDDYLFDDELLLIAEDGANLVMRNLPLAIIARGKFWVNNHAHILKPRRGNIEFLAWVLEGLNYLPWISGAAQPKLTQDRLMDIAIAVPPRDEQDGVMALLKEETVQLADAVTRAQQEMALVREYRTRLIADVVIGKLDVREAAAGLPDVDPLVANDTSDEMAEGYADRAVGILDPHP